MSEENPGSHPEERVLSTDVEGFDDLKALALDLKYALFRMKNFD